MVDRLLLNLSAGEVVTRFWPGGNAPVMVGRSSWGWPLLSSDLEDLRWYLEDYLRVPFGVYEDRGPAIQARLAGWGEQIFEGVFGSGAARHGYMLARESGRTVEVVLRSDSPDVLALPWELMTDKTRGVPLALDLGGMSRTLNRVGLASPVVTPGQRLRVLMVISRPSGVRDVGFRMIARPLLERLASFDGLVELTVLRPPTLDALRRTIGEAAAVGKPFQVMHFDGHGIMPPRPGGVLASIQDSGTEGLLVFEREDGSQDYVSARKLAAALREGQVPVVVLNACQSGAVGKQVEAAIATRLVGEGVASVVAMAYSVYAVAAAEFMTAFYGALFDGEPVSGAVAAGRRQLFEHDLRPSPTGGMPLADWMVPVHYWRGEVRFPALVTSRFSRRPPLARALDPVHESVPGREAAGDGAADGFVGRDALFCELEMTLRAQKVIVLHGPAGTGKTELARAFAAWRASTGGLDGPDGVLWHSFEHGTAMSGLNIAVNEIGLKVFGQEFALLDQAQRINEVTAMLRRQRMLLVWDNFETFWTMPSSDPGVSRPDNAARATLQGFISEVAAPGGLSAVLITSRTPEDWLGDVHQLKVGGLEPAEAVEYAEILLARYPAARQRRSDRLFGDLMKLLDGHPLSMRIILPLLDSLGPEELLYGLRGTLPLPGSDTADRSTSLPASVAYSFRHLDEQTSRLLPAAALCQSVVDVDLLTGFSAAPGVPTRFRATDRQAWEAVLDAGCEVGLLTRIEDWAYQMHPALPAYLASYWRSASPAGFEGEWDAARTAMATAAAGLAAWLREETFKGDAGFAHYVAGLQHGTLAWMLGYAVGQQQWDSAAAIFDTLGYWWTTSGGGISAELEAWAARIVEATEHPPGTPPGPGSAQRLWLVAASRRAGHWVVKGRLDDAEGSFRQILSIVSAQPPSQLQREIMGRTYFQLGLTEYIRGRKQKAQELHQESVAIQEGIGNRVGMAENYVQLGQICRDQGHWAQAEEWCRKAAAISAELGNMASLAAAYLQLGSIAGVRVNLEDADSWNRKALAIYEEIGNSAGTTVAYLQLGNTSRDRGWLDATDEWYRKSLVISERIGNRKAAALCCSLLGNTAEERGRLDIADEWYRKSLAAFQVIGDRANVASLYGDLGGTALERGWLDAADDWHHKSLAIYEELGNQTDVAASCVSLGNIARKRGILSAADKWYRRSLAISEELEDLPSIADICLLIGMNARAAGHLRDAEKWYRRSVAVNEQFGNRRMMAAGYMSLAALDSDRGAVASALGWVIMAISLGEEFHDAPFLAYLASKLGEKALKKKWLEVTGHAVPEAVLSYVRMSRTGAAESARGGD